MSRLQGLGLLLLALSSTACRNGRVKGLRRSWMGRSSIARVLLACSVRTRSPPVELPEGVPVDALAYFHDLVLVGRITAIDSVDAAFEHDARIAVDRVLVAPDTQQESLTTYRFRVDGFRAPHLPRDRRVWLFRPVPERTLRAGSNFVLLRPRRHASGHFGTAATLGLAIRARGLRKALVRLLVRSRWDCCFPSLRVSSQLGRHPVIGRSAVMLADLLARYATATAEDREDGVHPHLTRVTIEGRGTEFDGTRLLREASRANPVCHSIAEIPSRDSGFPCRLRRAPNQAWERTPGGEGARKYRRVRVRILRILAKRTDEKLGAGDSAVMYDSPLHSWRLAPEIGEVSIWKVPRAGTGDGFPGNHYDAALEQDIARVLDDMRVRGLWRDTKPRADRDAVGVRH